MEPLPPPLPTLYDARGNRYAVAHPGAFPARVPAEVAVAARTVADWGPGFLQAAMAGRSDDALDGIVIGPFASSPPFDVMILNTDGSLAERSGNGLTIFARAMVDSGAISATGGFDIRVHHGSGEPDPLVTRVHVSPPDRALVEFGAPSFGPDAVSANASAATVDPAGGWTVPRLAEIDASWTRSVLARLGNPHCVTFLASEEHLPTRERVEALAPRLAAIAFAPEQPRFSPFRRGVNLQWAARSGRQRLDARIFERGEGWTQSSGSSASAVAAAAFLLGEVEAGAVTVRMPGGDAEVVLHADAEGRLEQVVFSGRACRLVD